MTCTVAAGVGLRELMEVVHSIRQAGGNANVLPIPGRLIATAGVFAHFMGVDEKTVLRQISLLGIPCRTVGKFQYVDADDFWNVISGGAVHNGEEAS